MPPPPRQKDLIYKKYLNVCWQLLQLTRIYSSFQVNGICMFRSTKHKVSSNQQPVTWEDGTRYSDRSSFWWYIVLLTCEHDIYLNLKKWKEIGVSSPQCINKNQFFCVLEHFIWIHAYDILCTLISIFKAIWAIFFWILFCCKILLL